MNRILTLRDWAISVLQESGGIRECESTAGCTIAPKRDALFRRDHRPGLLQKDQRLVRASPWR